MKSDDATFWTDPGLDGLQCLRATYVRHRFSTHVHDGYAIGVIESGAQRVRCRGGHEIMPERTVCVINPFEPHTGQAASSQGWTYRMIYPSGSVLRDVASQMGRRMRGEPYFRDLVIMDGELMELFERLHVALERGLAPLLTRQSLLLTFLAGLIRRHAEDRPSPDRSGPSAASILRARDYLRERCADTVSLYDLASLAGLSPFHFMRAFRKLVGVPAHAYQIHCRIEAAKGMLDRGLPLARIAAETGFTDQSHFTRAFKTCVGVTPGKFRP